MKNVLTVVFAGGVALLVGAPAQAQAPDLSRECSAEVSRFCPSAKTNDEIMDCIDKREKMGKKKSGVSKNCYEAHEKLETPEHEKTEKHEGGEKMP
jgi:hypothetical protein